MGPLGKRIIVLTMAWVFLVMIVSQIYDNATGKGMPLADTSLTPVATVEPTVGPDQNVQQLADLESCVASDPNNFQCVLDLADAYYADQQYAQAQVDYEQAHKLDPKNVQVLLKLAGTYIYQNDFDQAVNYLKQAEVLSPTSPEIHLLLGLSLSKLDPPQTNEALAEWRTVISLAPNSQWATQANAYITEAGVH